MELKLVNNIQPGQYYPSDPHRILSYSYKNGKFSLGNDDTIKIQFDHNGMDIGCKRITAEAFEALMERWTKWKKVLEVYKVQ